MSVVHCIVETTHFYSDLILAFSLLTKLLLSAPHQTRFLLILTLKIYFSVKRHKTFADKMFT